MPFPTPVKRAAIVAAALLLGAPTAGAALSSQTPAPHGLPEGVLKIELVIPPEPEIHPAYPIATFDGAPPNDFKRPPSARRWGYGFPGMETVAMWAEPQGAALKLEEPAPVRTAELHSSFEPASGWLDE